MLKKEDNEYLTFLSRLKNKIMTSQQDAVIAVNKELIMLYWEIGNLILQKKNEQGWEEDIINNLSNDLKIVFPDMQGFYAKNIKYMCKFAEEYKDQKFIEQVASQISWSHNLILMDKISDVNKTISYINKIIENGWSKSALLNKIELEYGIGEDTTEEDITTENTSLENNLEENNVDNSEEIENKEIENEVAVDSNSIDIIEDFNEILPIEHSEMSIQMLKDSYMLDLLNFSEKTIERDLEKQLINHITKFFIELHAGFAFVGDKYHLEVAGGDYYIDLLFYNLNLRCYVCVELKIGKFKPEYLGKLSFHLSLIDDALKGKGDNSAIGIILCKDEEKLIVQYAFKDTADGGDDTEYKLTQEIPDEFKNNLPSVKKIGDGIKEKLIKEI